METRCDKCKIEIYEKDTFVVCDCCSLCHHEKCVELSSSEVRVLALKKRNMIYFCNTCRMDFKKVPKVIAKLDEVLEINKKLVEENRKLREIINNSDKLVEANLNTAIQEIHERQIRSANIIVTNIQESAERDHGRRSEDDTDNVNRILGVLSRQVKIKKTFRLGKFCGTRNRPLKVVLSNSDEALYILRNKKSIQVPNINIFGDQTKMQRDYYLSVKKKLADMISQGDNDKTIKYVNNIPTIVNKSVSQQSNGKN